MSVGEATGTTLAQTSNLVDDRRHELNMIFNFDAIKLGRSDFGLSQLGPWSLPELKAIYDDHARVLTRHDWDTVFLSNHDNPASSPPLATTRPPCASPPRSSSRP